MSIVEEGQLKGSFKGFKNRETVFEFYAGKTWKQNEYKYHYHYAYMPRAKVINEGGRYYLEVEGTNEKVEVKRV
ncbi:hypothetical protein [Microbulbifer sp. SAOS-129_SWC]|uniref:hypothetical protein n=1 Tax=Microbulbifer sp. SAOS-129_SWC TaxID=3145235 RepID=UPI003216B07E